ncbi:MAG: late competence development ComFB family protein [Acidobacteriota bacterium]|nr:MAG: late competence development ComFB family protein [Acidobacteriota bacterium]
MRNEPHRSHRNEQDLAEQPSSSLAEMRHALGMSFDRIRNAVEVLACRLLEQKLLACPEICHCQQCVEDMYCLALNRVPALYYHSTSSFARRLEDQGPPTDILQALDRAIDRAILKVGENPSH